MTFSTENDELKVWKIFSQTFNTFSTAVFPRKTSQIPGNLWEFIIFVPVSQNTLSWNRNNCFS